MTTHTRPFPNSAASAEADRGGSSATSAIVRMQRGLQILRLLQAGQTWSAQELAEQFDCSTRTIFRDVQLLRECGIPIDSPRGERGFHLSHDFFWKPVRPTLDEMVALVVGVRMAGKALPKQMRRNLDSVLAKLLGAERPAVRQRLSEINLRIDAPHTVPRPLPEVNFLPQLLEHMVAQTPVCISIRGADNQSEVQSLIPVRLHYGDGQWLLIAVPGSGANEQPLPLDSIESLGSSGAASREEATPPPETSQPIEPPHEAVPMG